jgi:lipid-A-disaccharide synthase
MRFFLLAGEKSGDLHGGRLIKELKKQFPQAEFKAWGGEQMQQAGATITRHYSEIAVMGFLEVAKNLFNIRRWLKDCRKELDEYQPDCLILIDFAGFNLRVAAYAKKLGIPVYYFISPKVWAWNQSRAKKIVRLVDHMFVIMPFEEAFYQQYNFKVDYVGNPLYDAVQEFVPAEHLWQKHQLPEPDKPVLALLPGSRVQELQRILPTMLQAVALAGEAVQPVIAGVPELPEELYAEARAMKVPIIYNDTYNLLHNAQAALVTSGTATLETALLKVPQVVAYKTSAVTAAIVKQVIKVPYISLVNLLAEQEVVKELIQQHCTPEALWLNVQPLLTATAEREQMLSEYNQLSEKLKTEGAAAKMAALVKEYLAK